MEYLLLIYGNEKERPQHPSAAFDQTLAEYRAFNRVTEEMGVLRSLNPLVNASEAKTVRVRDEKSATTDGPFAETKEQLAGYYLLDCESIDQAVELAARIPGARTGCIEVRAIANYTEL